MEDSTHQILLNADRLDEWWCPSDLKYNLRVEVESLVPSIESIVGRKLDVDRDVQDASFLTDVGLLDDHNYDRKSGTGAICYVYSFPFSNFGRLFTLHGKDWKKRFDEFRLGDVVTFVSSRGFIYIRADDLDSPYDGVNGPNNPISGSPLTWWIRYFDYI